MKKLANLSLALGSVLTVTTIGTFALPSGEAQALTLDGSITIDGSDFNPDITSGLNADITLQLIAPTVIATTGDFATSVAPSLALLNSNPTISDIFLDFDSQTGNTYNYTANAVGNTPFIDFGNTTIQGENGELSFVLDPNQFDFQLNDLGSGNVNGFSGLLNGNFMFGDETIATGNMTIGESGPAKEFGITLTTNQTPEPSALVGLVGVLGLGALVKKGKK